MNATVANFSCSSSAFAVKCSLSGTSLSIVPISSGSTFPINTTLTISNMFVPLANVSAMPVQSYMSGYLASEYDSITWQSSCTLPCYTCTTPTTCLSCFTSTAFTTQIYFYQSTCLVVVLLELFCLFLPSTALPAHLPVRNAPLWLLTALNVTKTVQLPSSI